MPSHNEERGREPENVDPEKIEPEKIDTSAGYETSDVRATGIIVFLVAMGIFVAVVGIVCYGLGKVMNAYMNRQDGPNSRWTKTVDIRQLGEMPSNPAMQNKVAELTQSFPTPRVQTDDGNQDVADLHQREDLLLDHYSWVDDAHSEVRIPIERAMELTTRRGLPVAPAVQAQQPMTGDAAPQVTLPLTNGFARTAYEQAQEEK